MKKYKHLLALLLAVCMLLCIIPAVSAEEAAPLATEDEVVIYYTNDVHTYIDGDFSYDNIAALKAQTAEITDVLLVDAGDHIQGTAYGSLNKGETIAELMEAAGYDLATLGNHEFDYGMERALEIAQGNVPYVSANFYHEKDGVAGDTVLPAYEVFETKNGKIAIIGVTTPETFTKSTPAYFQDEEGNYIYGIAGGTDGKALYAAVQDAIDAASEEADIVIALAHLGDDPASKPWTSEEVIANTTGLDAFIDGHSHSTVPMKEVEDKEGNTVILTQTGEYFGAIGRMSITAEGIQTELVEGFAGSDADVEAIKDEWIAEVDELLGEVIGKAEVTFDNYDEDGNRLVRKQETNTGDFAADALYYLFDNMGLDVDVAIMNGGGVRSGAITGDISYKTCKEIHTFGNVACLQTITGQQLLDALEWGAKNVGTGENGGFLHVSGITYEIHAYIESTVQADDKGVWTGGPTGEYRVKNVKILQDGEYVALDLDAEYNLAGYNYTLRDLGDGFAMFDGAVNVLDYVMEDYMVLANYVKSFEDGVIPADSIYADVNGAGRIEIVDDLAAEDEIVIYYTNDVHTYIDSETSYDNIAALKTATEAYTDYVLLVDAGDHIQGTAYGSLDKGAKIVELMEAAGYDLATLGNHEFDYGMERALEVAQGNVPYVSANFYHEKDGIAGESVLPAYKVFEMGEKKIAIIGITTPETFTKSTPAYFQDEDGNYIYGIAGGTDGAALYAAVQDAIDAASEEADIVIALAHLGDDPASKPWTSEEVIANTTGLDAFIDGHSHSTVPMKEVEDKEGNTVILTQTGEYFGAIGRMSITDEGIEAELLDGFAGSDAEVKAIQDEWIAEVDEQLGEVIGKAEVTFDNYDADGNRLVRKQETNTGDFAADALYYLFDNMDLDVDVAIMNGGGVRNKAITGDITYKVCKEIHTFGNVACLQTITGQQLLDALEWGAKSTPDAENGGFLHVSGITYEIHTYIESGCKADDKGVWTGHEGEYRVKNVKILQDGEYVDLDLDAEYNLAGYNYTLRDLGDGFAMFDGAVNVLDYVMEDYMVLANYVKSFDKGVIPADSIYADVNGAGRIVMVDEEPEPPVDLGVLEVFTDVKTDKYYSEALAYMVANEYIKGMTETTMEPNGTLTRGQLVTILYRMEGEPTVGPMPDPFTDVPAGKFYTEAVLWAASEGIVNGVTETTFAPGEPVTRQQIAAILYRAAGSPEVEGDLSAFDDGENVSAYAEDALVWATQVGLINGVSDNGKLNVDAKGDASRAQAATILYRWLDK